MKSRLNNRKGFTLIELIIAILILGVVMTAIYTFFMFGNKMSVKGNEQYTIQSDARLDINQIISDVTYATEVTLLSTAPTASEKASSVYSYIYIENGKITRSIYNSATGIRTEKTLIGTRYSSTDSHFSKVTGSTDSIKIQLSSQYNDQTYTVDSVIKLPNFSLQSPVGTVQGSATSLAIKFKVPG